MFALPFALTGALLAWRDQRFHIRRLGVAASCGLWWLWCRRVLPPWRSTAFWTRISMRATAAPRAAHLPAGLLSAASPGASAVALLRLHLGRAGVGPLCFLLSPVAFGDLFFYSFSKRFTMWSHSDSGFLSRHRPGGRLDRDARIARSANPVADRRRDVLDCRIRRDLCVPGLRIRLCRKGYAAFRGVSALRTLSGIARMLHVCMIVCLWRW